MIKRLTIQNYALIDSLQMTPASGLNIITGETGAGKSIMLGAVGLLMGERSDRKVLLSSDKKCIVEGEFEISDYGLQHFFDAHEIDYDKETIIRREISPSGKSRAFLNDTPVALPVLKELGSHLMDVHSQHESLQLNKKIYQLQVLDAFAAHKKQLTDFQESFKKYSVAKTEYDRLVELANQSAEDSDYKQFLFEELQQANLDELNQEELEQELKVLEHAEDIKLKLSQSAHILDGDEISVLQMLNEIAQQLSSVSSFSKDLESLADRIDSQRIEMMDIHRELESTLERTAHNPEQMQALKDQLDLLYRLQKKHEAPDVGKLIEVRDKLDNELAATSNLDEQIEKAKQDLQEAEGQMLSDGEILRESRQLASQDLAAEIEKIIRRIGIENGQIEIKVLPAEPSIHGIDTVEIKFSANKGIAPQEVSQVASGGEFSRLIFAIKYLIAGKTAMPTVIFDEIDTGVSGEVAIQMVNMMKQMANNHQVIAISHLPQFAAGGDAHYFVYKDHAHERSISKIRKLETEDRIAEIAKMIGGKKPTDAAYSSARELLGIS